MPTTRVGSPATSHVYAFRKGMSITCLRCRARLNDSIATRNNARRTPAMNSIPAMVPATTSRSTHRPDTKDIGTAVAQLHLESATGGFSEAVSFLLDLVEELLWRLTLIFTLKVPSPNEMSSSGCPRTQASGPRPGLSSSLTAWSSTTRSGLCHLTRWFAGNGLCLKSGSQSRSLHRWSRQKAAPG